MKRFFAVLFVLLICTVSFADDVYDIAFVLQRVVTESDLVSQMVKKGLERAAGFNWSDTVAKTLEAARNI